MSDPTGVIGQVGLESFRIRCHFFQVHLSWNVESLFHGFSLHHTFLPGFHVRPFVNIQTSEICSWKISDLATSQSTFDMSSHQVSWPMEKGQYRRWYTYPQQCNVSQILQGACQRPATAFWFHCCIYPLSIFLARLKEDIGRSG